MESHRFCLSAGKKSCQSFANKDWHLPRSVPNISLLHVQRMLKPWLTVTRNKDPCLLRSILLVYFSLDHERERRREKNWKRGSRGRGRRGRQEETRHAFSFRELEKCINLGDNKRKKEEEGGVTVSHTYKIHEKWLCNQSLLYLPFSDEWILRSRRWVSRGLLSMESSNTVLCSWDFLFLNNKGCLCSFCSTHWVSQE